MSFPANLGKNGFTSGKTIPPINNSRLAHRMGARGRDRTDRGLAPDVPCLYRFDGRNLRGGFGRGWAVDVRYRAFSLLLVVRQLQQPNVDLRVTSTASPKTSVVLTKQGWSRVPAGEWDRSALW